jgi:sialic acid synthase SpsE
LRRADGGVDSAFSLEPHELASLVTESERAWQALGQVSYTLSDKEMAQTVFKRSIYADRDLPAGHRITQGDIRVVRPAKGAASAPLRRDLRPGAGTGGPQGRALDRRRPVSD